MQYSISYPKLAKLTIKIVVGIQKIDLEYHFNFFVYLDNSLFENAQQTQQI